MPKCFIRGNSIKYTILDTKVVGKAKAEEIKKGVLQFFTPQIKPPISFAIMILTAILLYTAEEDKEIAARGRYRGRN